MDHFNITIQDGAMISTRRGFKVSKQKHNGTAFINSSASNIAPTGTEPGSGSLLPTAGELTFVNNGGDGRKSRRKTRTTTQDGRKTGSRSAARESAPHRHSPGTRLSSSSPRTTVSDTFNSEHSPSACSASSLNHPVSTPLPPWAAYSHHSQTHIDPAKRLRFMALAFGHTESGRIEETRPPGDVRPVGVIEKSTWQIHDPTTIHCALTMGALFDAVKEGRYETPQLTSLASQLYSIVNRRVSENDRSDKARDVTIRAVASLAIISGYQGKSKHWNVHMRGLLNLVDISGGHERLFPGTLDVIRCADIIGALSAAINPSIILVGLPCKARYISRLEESGNTIRAVRRSLGAFNFDKEMMDILAAAAKLCEEYTARQDQDTSSSQQYAPEMLEDFHYLSSRLLTIPEPLREYDTAISPLTSMNLTLDAQMFPASNSREARPDDASTKAMETALRILVLMYLKELMLDVPCNDQMLLDLLAKQVLLLLSSQCLNTSCSAKTPALMWIGLAGQVFTTRKRTAWHGDFRGQNRIYAQLLDRTLGIERMAETDSVSKELLLFCRCFDLQRIQGAAWDDNEALKNMLEINKN